MNDINLVIPTTKLDLRLFTVIRSIKSRVSICNSTVQVTVVLNPPRNLESEEKSALEELNVELIMAPLGLGNALRQSYKSNNCETFAFVPDDLPFGFQEIDLSLEFDSKKQDLLVLSKYKKSSNLTLRLVVGRTFRLLSGFLFRIPVSDTQSSFIASRSAVSLFAENCREGGYLITLENILVAQRYRLKISEVAASWKDNAFYRKTNITLTDPIVMAFQLIVMRVRHWIWCFR